MERGRIVFGNFLCLHEWDILSVRDGNVGRFPGHPGESTCRQLDHVLHPPPLVLCLLLHVPGRVVNPAVEDKEDNERAPVVANDEGRVEDGVFEELDGALPRAQVPIALVVFPAEDAGKEEDCGDDPSDRDHEDDAVLGPPGPVASRNLD